MQTKVVSIVPVSVLPDGEYKGTWGGYEVTVEIAGLMYRMKTENGIRTPSAPCIVRVENGSVTINAGYKACGVSNARAEEEQ